MKIAKLLFTLLISLTSAAGVAADSWGLLLYKEGSGQGRVCVVYDERSECQVDDVGTETNIELNENINLRATPEPGSHFVQWVGDCRGRNPTCRMLTLKPHNDKPLSATAIFAQGPAAVIKPNPTKKIVSAKTAAILAKSNVQKAKVAKNQIAKKKAKKKKAVTATAPEVK